MILACDPTGSTECSPRQRWLDLIKYNGIRIRSNTCYPNPEMSSANLQNMAWDASFKNFLKTYLSANIVTELDVPTANLSLIFWWKTMGHFLHPSVMGEKTYWENSRANGIGLLWMTSIVVWRRPIFTSTPLDTNMKPRCHLCSFWEEARAFPGNLLQMRNNHKRDLVDSRQDSCICC